MAAGPDTFVGIDLGTSSVKVVGLDARGKVVARSKRGYATARPAAGAAEQSPGDWVSAVVGALKELSTLVPADSWRAIGLSGMLPTLVVLDAENQPLGPAVTWEDARAEAIAMEFRARSGPDLYERTGQRVDGRYLLPMYLRRKSEETGLGSLAAKVIGAKDYLFYVLTGELLTDPSTATGFGCFDLVTGNWDAAVSELPGIPEIAPSSHAGVLTRSISEVVGIPAGIPVVLGAADSVMGAFGLGARSQEDVAYVAGTSTVILGISDRFTPDSLGRFLVTPLAEGGFGNEMDLLSTGSAIQWLSNLLQFRDVDSLLEAAGQVPIGEAGSFLPYLAPGEQGALWSTGLRGNILGLTLASTGGQIARSLLNGILIESRRCIEVLRNLNPQGTSRILASGSGTSSSTFRQDLADVTGLPVLSAIDGESDHSSIGAAAFAAKAVDSRELASTSEFEILSPNPDRESDWRQIEARHEHFRLLLSGEDRTID
ncbi:MAG: FGGY-family carbohydrate kinase [Microbacteriaceae bacterium]|nr:FGGY-family carbohydrate kinase [Microbacteriaceae bacterium]